MAAGFGTLLPCLAQLGIAADERAGQRTARLYLSNIVGSALGSVGVGFILMDKVGMVGLGQILVLSSGLIAALLIFVHGAGRRGHAVAWAGAVAVLALALPTISPDAVGALLRKGAPGAPMTTVVENRSGIITVDSDGIIYGHGAYDGRFNVSLVNDTNGVVRPYAVPLLRPGVRHVLMIGFASGSWAQVLANAPGVEDVTVVEINPGYATVASSKPQVASVLTNPKVTLVVDDGRRWLRRNPGLRFDAIISNTSYHFRANASNLLSTEFMELARGHLAPGGLLFFNTTDSARAQRTACLAFPQSVRFTNHMAVSVDGFAPDFTRWRKELKDWRIDGKPVFEPVVDDAALDAGVTTLSEEWTRRDAPDGRFESCASILARTKGMEAITDDNMGTEWRYPLGLDRDAPSEHANHN